MPISRLATRRASRRAFAAAASAPESLAIGEQGADCATVGVPPLRIGSLFLFLHADSRVLVHPYSVRSIPYALFHSIVGRFFRDDDVMHVALAQPSGGDSNEPALLGEFLQRRRSHVAHAALESADELVGNRT